MVTRPDFSTFERIVQFNPGYNYLHETGPRARGQHGMEIRFVLLGPEGASQFLMFTGWTPLGEVDKDITFENGYQTTPVHIDTDNWRSATILGMGHQFGTVSPPMGADLGFHWSVNPYEDDGKPTEFMDERECDLLPGGKCFYDGSGLAASEVLKDFINEGDPAVWRWLERRYMWCLHPNADESEIDAVLAKS